VCIGAANLDRKLRVPGPLAMGSSNPACQDESYGGVARNIAENLARLGAPAALVTALGDDASGRGLQAHAETLGIDTSGILRLDGACSGTYTAVLDQHGEMAVALADMALYDSLSAEFLAGRQPQRANAALVVADLNLPLDSVAALLGDAVTTGVPLVLVGVSQTKMARLPHQLGGLRLLIVNEGELATRTGRSLATHADFAAACAQVQAQGAVDVIVTRGAQGVLYTSGDGLAHLAAPPAEVVDVTGAGDAFAAAVCWSLYNGDASLALACRRGLKLAALTLGSQHTVCPQLAPGLFDDLAIEIDQD
jgi:pseudouridine kinase